MEKPHVGYKLILSRNIDGQTELVEWTRHADTVRIVTESEETVIGPEAWEQAWADLEARGFIEAYPTDQRRMAVEKARILALVRSAFQGVTLGEGVGLRQGRGLDDYADERTLAAYRARDEKRDWSAIPIADLNQYGDALSFLDAEGMRFHLPAYLVAELEGNLRSVDILIHLVYMAYGAESRFDALSPAQRETVREYLLLQLSDAHQKFAHPMIQAALRDYWTVHTKT